MQICTENDDVLLTTAKGQCIRFAVPEVRVFKGRDSMGVRGINLAAGRRHHLDGDPAPCRGDGRGARRLSQDAPRRDRRAGERRGPRPREGEEEVAAGGALSPERYTEMSAHEQFILTLSERGYGKRTSSYEYRITGRGGKGITAMAVNNRNGPLVASFPVEHSDQIMLVTNDGQLIRVPVDGIRIVGRTPGRHRVLDPRRRARGVGRAYRGRGGARSCGRGGRPEREEPEYGCDARGYAGEGRMRRPGETGRARRDHARKAMRSSCSIAPIAFSNAAVSVARS